MPRNGSGTYSVPNTFTPLTPILSSAVNANFADAGAALTGSLPRDGQAGMTGPLAIIPGTAAAPGMQVAGSLTTGLYSAAANTVSVTTAGTERVRFNADGTLRGPAGVPLWAQLGASTDVQAVLSAADYAAIRTLIDVYTKSQVDAAIAAALSGGAVPIGAMIWWPRDTPPADWLIRDGAAISRTTYAALFALIGEEYGPGDGLTTFNLPDDRGQFIRAWAGAGSVDAGRVFGSLQADMVGPHDHPARPIGATVVGGASVVFGVTNSFSGATGTNSGTETRPVNRAYLPIIRAL